MHEFIGIMGPCFHYKRTLDFLKWSDFAIHHLVIWTDSVICADLVIWVDIVIWVDTVI